MIVLCVAVLASACERDTEPAADLVRASPHHDRFATFERWAHRTVRARTALSDAAVESTLFATLRLERAILAARVVRVGCREGSERCRGWRFQSAGASRDAQWREEEAWQALSWRSRRLEGELLEVCHSDGSGAGLGEAYVGLARQTDEVRVEVLFRAE